MITLVGGVTSILSVAACSRRRISSARSIIETLSTPSTPHEGRERVPNTLCYISIDILASNPTGQHKVPITAPTPRITPADFYPRGNTPFLLRVPFCFGATNTLGALGALRAGRQVSLGVPWRERPEAWASCGAEYAGGAEYACEKC